MNTEKYQEEHYKNSVSVIYTLCAHTVPRQQLGIVINQEENNTKQTGPEFLLFGTHE